MPLTEILFGLAIELFITPVFAEGLSYIYEVTYIGKNDDSDNPVVKFLII